MQHSPIPSPKYALRVKETRTALASQPAAPSEADIELSGLDHNTAAVLAGLLLNRPHGVPVDGDASHQVAVAGGRRTVELRRSL